MKDLLRLAKAAPPAGRKYRNTDRWMPTVSILRRKGYSYAAIHEWLKSQGEDVHPKVSTFTATVSRRYIRWAKAVSH
jgi:hypothetical protein